MTTKLKPLNYYIPEEMWRQFTPGELHDFMDEWYDMYLDFRIKGEYWCWEALETLGYMMQLEGVSE